MKMLSILILGLLVVSCGKKVVGLAATSTSNPYSNNKEFKSEVVLDDKSCIDDVLVKELGEKEIVKKVEDNADISFCNGLRVRIKIFKISNGELRVYGFATNSSGKTSCLRQGGDFQKIPVLGFQGTLVGDKVRISLGGHSYDSNNKLIKSDEFLKKFVKFSDIDYTGEMGFFEGKKLVCSAKN